MSTKLNPYLNFDGNCAEALTFYAGVFGTKANIMTFADSPMPAAPGTEGRVMHGNVPIGGDLLMASDTMPGMGVVMGTHAHLSLGFDDKEEQDRVWNALLEGGTATMPLGDQFFGRFGMLTDRFGVNWMLIFEPPRAG